METRQHRLENPAQRASKRYAVQLSRRETVPHKEISEHYKEIFLAACRPRRHAPAQAAAASQEWLPYDPLPHAASSGASRRHALQPASRCALRGHAKAHGDCPPAPNLLRAPLRKPRLQRLNVGALGFVDHFQPVAVHRRLVVVGGFHVHGLRRATVSAAQLERGRDFAA